MINVDFEARVVKTDEDDYPYDYLVLATGSRTTFFGTQGAEANAMDIKGLRDALRVRNHVIDCSSAPSVSVTGRQTAFSPSSSSAEDLPG